MPVSSTGRIPWPRRLAVVPANPRGAIYGTIVATAVVAASAHDKRPGLILAATVATLLIFWIAHVYAEVLAYGLRHGRLQMNMLPDVMTRELSMLAAPALSVVFLALVRLVCSASRLPCGLRCGTAWPNWSAGASTWDAGWSGRGRWHCSVAWSTASSASASSSSRSCCIDAQPIARFG
jgi:hypothetical protein